MAYPYLSDVVHALTGLTLPLPIPMFGLTLVAAIAIAAACFRSELARRYCEGRIGPVTRVSRDHGNPILATIPPQTVAWDFALTVGLAGILGARIFSFLENSNEFLADPIGQIFSRTGFTFYGGLIFGAIAGLIFVRRKQLPLREVLDAVAPAAMLGYALGRIGCQISGDGDWGIPANMALKPAWLPLWTWAQTYNHNIVGLAIPSPGVYPTPLYEVLMSLAAFAILWGFRRHPFHTGWLFALYLVLCGLERLLIEPIRVNTVVHLFGIAATQAQFISVVLIVAGSTAMWLLGRRPVTAPSVH
jgi:phosphatidylglycerol---prolipoprotein diacylglyceryl transferase